MRSTSRQRAWRTVAFDVSPAAVRLARQRHPDSQVAYQVADLLDLPPDLVGVFDLVVEVFTVQALAPSVRTMAVGGVRSLIAPGGELLAVEVVRPDDQDPADGPPWLLDRTEMASFAGDEVTLAAPFGPPPTPFGPTVVRSGSVCSAASERQAIGAPSASSNSSVVSSSGQLWPPCGWWRSSR